MALLTPLLTSTNILELNGIHTESGDEDVAVLGLGVAEGSMTQDDVLTWINKHRA